ncbi:MAG: methyltransferase domain-containing protein [Rhodospirillales bacterium]|nr:methyltransferase domain-containing protein [Rhodospirillales bacterium]
MSAPAAPQVWDPDHYLAFADLRLRPALDLLARVPLTEAAQVTDLGCGAGSVTPYLRHRFPRADIQGVDHSPEMLAAARTVHRDVAHWVQADVAHWQPAQAQDLIFSNAALHWLDGHEVLFPRLMGFVKPGGVLAVQMPDQFGQPSHVLMRETAAEGPWAQTLGALLRPAPVAEAGRYYDWLKPHCASVDIWRTTYVQELHGDDAALNWIASTALKPLLEALAPAQVPPFRERLAAKLREAYPKRANGVTLFAFQRLFIVAVRAEQMS